MGSGEPKLEVPPSAPSPSSLRTISAKKRYPSLKLESQIEIMGSKEGYPAVILLASHRIDASCDGVKSASLHHKGRQAGSWPATVVDVVLAILKCNQSRKRLIMRYEWPSMQWKTKRMQVCNPHRNFPHGDLRLGRLVREENERTNDEKKRGGSVEAGWQG